MNYKQKVLNRIIDYVKTSYTKADKDKFIMGELLYNHRCHFNCVQKIKEGKHTKVFLCIAIGISNDDVIVHFINGDDEGNFIDHTWGWLYEDYDYYIVKTVDKSEYSRIWTLLDDMKKHLVYLHSNAFLRRIFKFNKEIV